MDFITGIFDDKKQIEKETKELLEKGYKIVSCNISFEPKSKTRNNIYSKLWYFVALQKD